MSKISELSDGGSLVSSDYLIAVRSGGNVKVRMDQINVDQIDLGDNEFIRLGNSQDLTIVHAATQSIINQAGIGDLLIQKAGSTKLTVNSSGIDVTGTVTADGLTSAGNVLVSQSGANSSITINRTDEAPQYNLTMGQSGSSPFITGNDAQIFNINVDPDNTENSSAFHLNIDGNIALKADAGGDISFYEDTGTTAKFFWDASAETLGIGTSSPDRLLTLQGDNSYMWMKDAGGGNVAFIGGDGSNDGFLRLYNGSHTAKVEIQSDGDTYFNGGSVGIGTTSPTVGKLQVNDSSGGIVAITRTSGATSGNLGVIRFGNTDVDSNLANITAIQDGSTTSSALTFETQSTGGSTAERMRIDSDGQILSTANEPTVTLKCSDTSLGADQYIGGFKFEKTDGSGAGAGVVGGMRMRSEGGVGESTYLQFSTSSSSANDQEAMRISGGNLLVSTTDDVVWDNSANSAADNGHNLRADGRAGFAYYNATANANATVNVNRTGSDGHLIRLFKSGNLVGSIGAKLSDGGTSDGELYITSGNTGLFFDDIGSYIRPCNGSAALRDNTVDLGKSDSRFKALYTMTVQASTGTPSAPAYSFAADSNSGMYLLSADNLGFSVGGVQKIFLSATQFNMTGNGVFSGSISKGSGSFKIDHPLPEKTETHHLVHSFVESPQADNIYRGKVDLVDGSATVNIDDAAGMTEGTYVLLNTNTQCFTSNESGWTAVKGSVSGNTLTITAQDNTCTDTISWMVVGERHDQHMLDTEWTDENGRVIVEPLKES